MADNNPFLQNPFDKLADDISSSSNDLPEYERIQGSPAESGPVKPPADFAPLFQAAADKHGVPANVLMALAQQESSFNPDAIGPQTKWGRAKGIMQYIDPTAEAMGINPFDPVQSIDAAARQMSERLANGDSLQEAIMAHHGGDDRSIWGPKTRAYGQQVLAKAGQVEEPERSPRPEQGGLTAPTGSPASVPDEPYEADFDLSLTAPKPFGGDVQPIEPPEIEPAKAPEIISMEETPDAEGESADNEGSNILTDLGNLLAIGADEAALNFREGVRQVFGDSVVKAIDKADKWLNGKESEEFLNDRIDRNTGELTDLTQAAREKEWVVEYDEPKESKSLTPAERERQARLTPTKPQEAETKKKSYGLGPAWSDWRSYAAGLVQSLPETAVVMAPSGILSRGVYLKSLAQGASKVQAAKRAATTATISGGIAEGFMGGGATARDTIERINNVPDETLLESEAIQSLMSEGMDLEEAKNTLAEDAGTKGFIIGGTATGVFGGAGDRVLAKILTEGAGNRLTAGIRGAVAEGVFEEMPQEAAQTATGNYLVSQADPSVQISDDVLNAAAGGLVLGGTMGGGLGVAAGSVRRDTPALDGTVGRNTGPAPEGALERSVQEAQGEEAVESTKGQRVIVRTETGELGGIVEDYTEDGQGGFTARILGDDGMSYEFNQSDNVQINVEPEAEGQGDDVDSGISDVGATGGDTAETQSLDQQGTGPTDVADDGLGDAGSAGEPLADSGTGVSDADLATDAEPALTELTEPDDSMVLRTNGSPFASEGNARQAMRNRRLSGYEPREVAGGWALAPVETEERQAAPSLRSTGESDTVSTPAGRDVDVEYAVVEAGDLVTSNDETGNVNPDYPAELQPRDRSRVASRNQINEIAGRLNPRLLGRSASTADGAPIVSDSGVVESGNGRTLAIRQAYERGNGDAYRDWLLEQGYNTGGMDQPVLVRVRRSDLSPEDLQEYTLESNQRTTLSLSATEQAMADAGKVMPIIEDFAGGDINAAGNRDFVRKFVRDVVGQSERADMVDSSGMLSQEGRRRVEAAMMAAAYGDPGVVTDMFESADTDIKAIGGALMDAAGKWAAVRQRSSEGTIAEGVDLTDNLIDAVNLIRRARSEGATLPDLINQRDAFDGDIDPVTEGFLRIFYRGDNLRKARGRDKVADALNFYADQALASQPGASLFGDTVTGSQVLEATNERQRQQEGEQPAGTGRDAEDAGSTRGERQGSRTEAVREEAGQEAAEEASKPEPGISQDGETVVTKDGKTFANTRGLGIRFHGSSSAIDSPRDDLWSSLNIYGQGFYTTDAVEIARGYMRKGRGKSPSLYQVRVPDSANLYDLNQPMNDDVQAMTRDVLGEIYDDLELSAAPSLAEVMDEFRADSSGMMMSADEVGGYFDSIRFNLEQAGFNGYTHVGGDKTSNPEHRVNIYWSPSEDGVTIESDSLDNYEGKKASEVAPAEDVAPVLESYTEEEIRQREADQQAAQEAEAAAEREAEQRARADEQVGDFTLTGSDRVSDVAAARGQDDMFVGGQQESAQESEAESGPGTTPEIRDVSVDTFNSWSRQGTDGTKNGWTIFDDTMVRNQFVLMRKVKAPNEAGGGFVSAQMVSGFETRDQATQWAEDNPARSMPSGQQEAQPEAEQLPEPDTNTYNGEPIVTHTTKRGRELEGVVRDVPLSEAKEIDPYAFRKDGGSFIRLDRLREAEGETDAPGSTGGLESDRGDTESAQPVDGQAVQDDGRAGDEGAGAASQQAEQGGTPGQGDQRVSDDGAAAGGERSNQPIYNEDGTFAVEDGPAGDTDGSGGREPGSEREPVERRRETETFDASPSARSPDVVERKRLQKEAEGTPTTWGDTDNIRQALPLLLPEQQQDVVKSEKRLFTNAGNGMLFTNSTGTGKTAVSLGQAKRFMNAGQDNIIIVVPSDKIASDFVDFAKMMNIPLKQLSGINDNGGSGPVITTYANFAQNDSLTEREWDLVITDEAHKLSSAADGRPTDALRKLRALTGHHDGFYTWATSRYSEEYSAVQEAADALNEANEKGAPQAEQQRLADEFKEAETAWQEIMRSERPAWERRWKEQAGLPKTMFMSATPFPYVKNTDYAEGYLFNYRDPEQAFEPESGRYNTPDGRERFMMEHFGYRMRYNKLTAPEAEVESELLEQNFNQWLQDEGALSGRALDVPHDYDRRFMLVDDAVGTKIDEALQWLSEAKDGKYRAVGDLIRKSFDYQSRMYLLEAIKAKHVIPKIKSELKLGRKVVVFHDFKKGGGTDPFKAVKRAKSSDRDLNALIDEAFAERPDFLQMKLEGLNSPIATLQRAFPDILVFNGDVPKRERRKRANQFNDESSGRDVILVQSAAGQEGISFHDTTGNKQRALYNLGMPTRPVAATQIEGRIYRTGQASDAIFRYLTTGTAWEAAAFGSTIAERASTAENLALGTAARGLKAAFVEAYRSAETFSPSQNDGKGGKAFDRSLGVNESISEFQKAKTFYYAQQKNTKRRNQREGKDYFATPEPVGLKMVQFADIRPGDKVLEPSAGHGAIARFIPDLTDVTMVEPSYELSQKAALANGKANIINGKFEDLNIVNKYDAIVMNPPYGSGGKTSTEHLAKAARHIRDGGRIVALLPRGGMADKRLADFLESDTAKNLHQVARVDMPAKTFERAGTGVNTQIIVLERRDSEEAAQAIHSRHIDLSSADKVIELFDRIEPVEMPERVRSIRGEDPATSFNPEPLTVEDLDQIVRSGPVGPIIGRLIDAGSIRLHADPEALFGENAAYGTQAATDERGTIHLIAENLEEGYVFPTLLHEAFHGGVRPLIGSKQWDSLQGRLGQLYRQYQRSGGRARQFWDNAKARIDYAQKMGDTMSEQRIIEEFGAYAVEEYETAPATLRKWVDDLVGAIKAWLQRKFGIQAGQVTPAQIRALSIAALRNGDFAQSPSMDGVVFSDRANSLDAEERILQEIDQLQAEEDAMMGGASTDAEISDALDRLTRKQFDRMMAIQNEEIPRLRRELREVRKKPSTKPSDEALTARYDSPDEVPADVRTWVRRNAAIIVSDATDAVRWSRIEDTLSDDRYDEGPITIYRAAEAGADIRPGDWVTTDRSYGEMHLRRHLKGKGQIIEQEVDGRDVLVSPTGNSEEAIYAPRNLSGPVGNRAFDPKDASIVRSVNNSLPTATVEEITDESEIERIRAEYGSRQGRQAAGRNLAGRPAPADWQQKTRIRASEGQPAILYRGSAEGLKPGDFSRERMGFATGNPSAQLGVYFTNSRQDAAYYGNVEDFYADIRNPYVVDGAELPGFNSAEEAAAYRADIEAMGHDGIVIDYTGLGGPQHVIPFKARQAIRPEAKQNGAAQSIRRPPSKRPEEQFTDLTEGQKSFLGKIGPRTFPQRMGDRWRELTDNLGLRIRQAGVDRYAALLRNDKALFNEDTLEGSIASSSWVLARMSEAAGGALSSMVNAGRIYLDPDQKVIDVREGTTGFAQTMRQLGSPAEIDRFMAWVAANRSKRLAAEGRENLFTPEEIEEGIKLSAGRTEDGNNRGPLYAKVWKEFQAYRDDVLGIAETAGIITPEQRETWADEFYVPFYRVLDDDTVGGPKSGSGLSRQKAYQKLKGGKQNLNDLLENTLLNFHHLIQASLKNQAALQAVDNAIELEIAESTPESRRDKKASTFIMRGGEKEWYNIGDPLTFKAISALSDVGMNNTAMKIGRGFKRFFTNMTTITPQFVIANTLRDSLSAVATSPASFNFTKNLAQGAMTYGNDFDRARMLASGGAFSFGHVYGRDPEEVKLNLTKDLRKSQVLRDPRIVPEVILGAWRKWNDVTDFAENVNRAAIWKQNQGRGKLKASFEARDLMDFSVRGDSVLIRILVDLVPFLNARIQGLDKLYRAGVRTGFKTVTGKGNKAEKLAFARFMTVVGALSAVSMALFLRNWDDEEYRKLEDWQRDTYWVIRVGDSMFFIPKPFEVGAIATMAERGLEQFVDPAVGGRKFAERVGHMLTDTFAFDPIPQALKPAYELGLNEDTFTGRPIEGMGMQRLSPSLRTTPNTSRFSEYLSLGMEESMGLLGPNAADMALSPLQIDHLVRGYTGQTGAFAVGLADTMWRRAAGEEKPATRWYENQPVRRFYKNLADEDTYTRYGTLFYETLKRADRAYADLKKLDEYGDLERAERVEESEAIYLGMRKTLNQISRELSSINRDMKRIQQDKDMSGEAKRLELDRLRSLRNLIQEDVGKAIEEQQQEARN